jgi:glycosyltransferase involved in cell wall biosynthesis
VVIHNGIDPADIPALDPERLRAVREKLGIAPGKTVLGFTGFVREWHKLEQVIDLISERPADNLVLLLVGDGPARKSLEVDAERLGVSASFVCTGLVDRDAVYDYIALFDVALQPAVTYYASPLKMFEYLAMGKIIVAPDEANIKELLTQDESGILFDKDDVAAFKLGIAHALEINADAHSRQAFAANARAVITDGRHTWSENAHRIVALFEDCLTQREQRAERHGPA